MTYAKYLALLMLALVYVQPGFAQETENAVADDLGSVDSADRDDGEQEPALEIAGLSEHAGYGYDADYPIQLGGTREADLESRLTRYLDYIRSPSGAALSFRYDGSCCPFDVAKDVAKDEGRGQQGGTGFLQVYLLSAPGQRPVRIYVNGYSEGALYLPRGLVVNAPGSQADIEAAAKAVEAKNHWRAEQLLAPLADAGDMLAQYRLGQVFTDIQDYKQAYAWFLKAADQGHILSQFTMYNLYRNGLGVSADDAKASEWLRRAAADGHAGARVVIAHALLRKSASKDEIQQPEALLRLAAEQGEPSAQGVYGLMLFHGRGLRKDVGEGLMWLYLASRGGDRNAADYYGRLSAEQPSRMLSRITFAAEDWRERTAPSPVMALSDLPEIPD